MSRIRIIGLVFWILSGSAAFLTTAGAAAAGNAVPNVILVLTDDVGFAASSTFGGPVPTPTLDRLAANGLKYNRFHTTAICSPTRAALLTGRNHHAVGMGMLVDIPAQGPGYTARIPPSAATVARVLRDNGYSTAMFGKDHNIPGEERSPAGPFTHWPTGGRGFDYFYGFISGDSDQWQPALYEGISPVRDVDRPKDYLLDEEMADKAINWIHNLKAAAPEKPFFIYYSNGSAHAPHQATPEWIGKFKGRFDHGWDVEREQILERQKAMGIVPANTRLAARPAQIPAWDSLSDNEKKVYARFMEVFAAQLSFQDAQFGRVVDELERMGIADNTLILFVEGDNGGSAEGSPTGTDNELATLSTGRHGIDIEWLVNNLDELGGVNTYEGFQAGWAHATDTPFPWVKQVASHLGGTRNGLVVSWPAGIESRGEIRDQYHHVIDLMPTILEAAGIQAPAQVDGVEQQPIDGKSMVYSFANADAASVRRTQYYEILANRAIYHDGWVANTTPRNMPWDMPNQKATDTSTYGWELYNLEEDFSQSNNLAETNPGKLAEMQAIFDEEAKKYNVYPLQDAGGRARAGAPTQMPRTEHVFWGRDVQLQFNVGPQLMIYMPFTVTAEIDVPEGGGDGVLFAGGSRFGGWSFYLDDGVPVAYASTSGLPLPGKQSRVAAGAALEPGRHSVSFDFSHEGAGGEITISVDGKRVATGQIVERPAMLAGGGETFDSGRDSNVAVSPDYTREGVFNGELHKVEVKVKLPLMARVYMGWNALKSRWSSD